MALPEINKYQDLEFEKRWHEATFYVDLKHWSSHPLFASRLRHWMKYTTDKIRFYSCLYDYVKNKPYAHNAKVLLAPAGSGFDLQYLQGIYSEAHGIDISPLALASCPGTIIKREGDILNSGYESGSFDIISCANFLHHIADAGLESFIREFHKLLKKGGVLAILEPSSLYPVSWLSGILNKSMGNITGKVEGERAISPLEVVRLLKGAGFARLKVRGISYNHARFPCAAQLAFNFLDFPLRYSWPFSLSAESVGLFCEKV